MAGRGDGKDALPGAVAEEGFPGCRAVIAPVGSLFHAGAENGAQFEGVASALGALLVKDFNGHDMTSGFVFADELVWRVTAPGLGEPGVNDGDHFAVNADASFAHGAVDTPEEHGDGGTVEGEGDTGAWRVCFPRLSPAAVGVTKSEALVADDFKSSGVYDFTGIEGGAHQRRRQRRGVDCDRGGGGRFGEAVGEELIDECGAIGMADIIGVDAVRR